MAHRDILESKVDVELPGKKNKFFKKDGQANVWLGKGTRIDRNVQFFGNCVVGNYTHIESGAKLDNCVIGDHCSIGSSSQIAGSVLWDRVKTGPEATVRESVIGEQAQLGKRSLIQVGSIIADECQIGTEAKIRSNVKVWPHKTIEDGAVLGTSLIWGEKWTRSLFGGYGISGLGNIEMTPEFAAKVGAAYGAFLGKGSYVVTSRDAPPLQPYDQTCFNFWIAF